MAERDIVRVTFSMDREVFNALAATAKVQRRTKSGMLNWVVAQALLGGDSKPPADIHDKDDDAT